MRRLGIIGLGPWGRRLVQSVQNTSARVKFDAAVVSRPEASEPFAAEQGLSLTSDLASMLSDSRIDGVVSCGPAHLHAQHSLAALRAGKSVLAVKPMALNVADAHALMREADRQGLLLALGYNRCFFPNVQDMRSILRTGALGELLHAEGNFCVDRYGNFRSNEWKADPTKAPPGGLADHMLYLAIDTLGAIADVFATAFHHHSNNGLADVSTALLRTRNRQSVVLTGIGVTPDYYRFQVFGSKGWIELRDDTHLIWKSGKAPAETRIFDPIDAERAEVEAFADALVGDPSFPVPAGDAVHGVEVLEAIARSANEHRLITL